ncbi:hypothetical protein GCM10009551_097890 [Nocardiopsis tropica]|uniref:phage major capsid protein n=1 Tax=Tsukamurella strandjordii TaxID=147577 RepID=UPI0031E40C67
MTRTITGRILPYGQYGKTNVGPVVFDHRSLHVPNDLTKVKLLRDHSTHGGGPVGVLASFHADETGVYATFTIPETAAGDEALIEALTVRNRFSVEVEPVTRNGPVITAAVLKAVALVPYPAFQKAEVFEVTNGTTTQTPTQATTAAPAHQVDASEQPAALILAQDTSGADALANTTPAGAPATSAAAPAPAPTPTPAVVPSPLAGLVPSAAPVLEFEEVVRQLIEARKAGGDMSLITAELVDITNAGHPDISAPDWLGQLWSGVTYQRRVIPLLTNKPLRNRVAKGWRWTKKPGVAKWAGNKTDIPSFPTATEPEEIKAQPWAGGNDIDRSFLDFNDTEFIAEYWRAMAESYAMETDLDFAAWLTANATTHTGRGPYTDPVRAISSAAVAIGENDTNGIGTPATFAIVNPLDLELLLDVSQLEAPHYGNIAPLGDPSKWTTSSTVTQGSAIVGAKSAASFFELPGSPLRAQAAHIAKGGFDAALFGYTAAILNKPEGLKKVSWTAPAPTPAPAGQ